MVNSTFKKISIAFGIVCIAAVIYYMQQRTFAPYEPYATRVQIGDTNIHAHRVDTPKARAQGLSNTNTLGWNEGMLFVFSDQAPRQFWMRDMRYALDILWIADSIVVDMQENIAPVDEFGAVTRFSTKQAVDMALELNAGFIGQNNLKIGDVVNILTE